MDVGMKIECIAPIVVLLRCQRLPNYSEFSRFLVTAFCFILIHLNLLSFCVICILSRALVKERLEADLESEFEVFDVELEIDVHDAVFPLLQTTCYRHLSPYAPGSGNVKLRFGLMASGRWISDRWRYAIYRRWKAFASTWCYHHLIWADNLSLMLYFRMSLEWKANWFLLNKRNYMENDC